MSQPQAYLELKNFNLASPSQNLLHAFHFFVSAGEILCIMGPSGCGKSSLLLYILGLLPRGLKANGEVVLSGKKIHTLPTEKKEVGIVFQDPLLFPHMNVLENLMFAIPTGMAKNERRELAFKALQDCKLENYAKMDANQLSGGQKARISLFRSLLARPKALLLDEPFSKLDAKLKKPIQDFFLEHVQKNNLPTVLVTHDPLDAKALGKKILELPESSPF